jgi:membrane protein required for colicin V production
MVFDILFGICLFIVFFRGWQKGILWTFLQFIAVLIALPLSLKLSHAVNNFMTLDLGIESRLTFLLSFIALFIVCMLLFRLAIKLVEKSLDALMMGWVNRLMGAALYGLIITFFFSTLIWLGKESGLMKDTQTSTSKSIPIIEPVAPFLIKTGSAYTPVLGNLYQETRDLLQQINERIEKIPLS